MTASHKRERSHRAMVDTEFPFQVALPNDLCCMENHRTLMDFCERLRVPHHTRQVRAVWPDGTERDYRLYCFATRELAGNFARHFDGVHFDPSRDREKRSARGAWHRTDSSAMPERCGPLVMPKWFQQHP